MADTRQHPGRLIAVDGSRGKDTNAAADAIAETLKHAGVECAVSRWDASGLFSELAAAGRDDRRISTRTLSLVYAADLAFRLRWEIRPILESGGVIIAAPYLETAVAFGGCCGIDSEWLRELLRFAPAPDLQGRTRERKVDRPWKARVDRGYPEYGAFLFGSPASRLATKAARRDMMTRLEKARGRRVFDLTGTGVAAIAKALTDSQLAASRPPASRPRNARK